MPVLNTEIYLDNGKHLTDKVINTSKYRILRTDAVGCNVSGALMSKDGGFWGFNIFPHLKTSNYETIKQAIVANFERLSDISTDIWGFICGGWKNEPYNALASCSYEMYNTIADTFDRLQLPFAMFCGKKADDKSDALRIRNNRITMWGENIERNLKKDENIFSLNSVYDDIEIPDTAEINIFHEYTDAKTFHL